MRRERSSDEAVAEGGSVSKVAGRNVKTLRRLRGMNAAQLAERMTAAGREWDRFTVAGVEQGRRRLDVDELVVLGEVLGVEPATLLRTVEVRVVPEGVEVRPAGLPLLLAPEGPGSREEIEEYVHAPLSRERAKRCG